jgi:hypothetical protein
MPRRNHAKLSFAFRQGDVESTFTTTDALQQILESQSRFAGPRPPFDQIETISVEPATQDIVQS